MLQPPSYCLHAIATDNGWVNPKNGELLVAIKNLSTRIKELPPIDNVVVEIVKEDIVDITENNVEDVIIDGPVEHVLRLVDEVNIDEELPQRKRPGRPKKSQQAKENENE